MVGDVDLSRVDADALLRRMPARRAAPRYRAAGAGAADGSTKLALRPPEGEGQGVGAADVSRRRRDRPPHSK